MVLLECLNKRFKSAEPSVPVAGAAGRRNDTKFSGSRRVDRDEDTTILARQGDEEDVCAGPSDEVQRGNKLLGAAGLQQFR